MWAFTGGCHYAGDCLRYRASCGSCPQLRAGSPQDISAKIIRQKREAWADLPLQFVTISRWLADCAAASPLLKGRRIEVIGNPH